MYVPPHRNLLICYNWVVYTYSCSQKLHIICICSNGMWAVRSSVSAVRQHCVNTNRYNTQHTSYTPCVSLKLTANNKLHAAQCFWSSQQLHSQSSNMEQEGSLPWAQQPSTFSYPEQNESNHISQCVDLLIFNIYFNIILPSIPTFLKWFSSLTLSFPDIKLVFQTCFM